jgi:hypothetical protein
VVRRPPPELVVHGKEQLGELWVALVHHNVVQEGGVVASEDRCESILVNHRTRSHFVELGHKR